ncbi:hypothetical protein V6N13_123892 [Hibiscus sabdariffa]
MHGDLYTTTTNCYQNFNLNPKKTKSKTKGYRRLTHLKQRRRGKNEWRHTRLEAKLKAIIENPVTKFVSHDNEESDHGGRAHHERPKDNGQSTAGGMNGNRIVLTSEALKRSRRRK